MIACVDSDAENIFIALTARELRSDIFIVARASAEDSEKKLLRAGADRVISPVQDVGLGDGAGGAASRRSGGAVDVADYRMEEIEVSPRLRGRRQDRSARSAGESVIVAVRRADGQLETQPPAAVRDRGRAT